MTVPLCEIRWIDNPGRPTPDRAPALGWVRCKAYTSESFGVRIQYDTTEWFPICAFHQRRLAEPEIELWSLEPLQAQENPD